MTIDEVLSYAKESTYLHIEAQGKKVKRPNTMQQTEYEAERKERIRKLYAKV